MASHFRSLFRALSFEYSNLSIGKLVRGNFTKSLGSNHRGRNCVKLLGYSASIASFGYLVEAGGRTPITQTTVYREKVPHLPRKWTDLKDTQRRVSASLFEGRQRFFSDISRVIQEFLKLITYHLKSHYCQTPWGNDVFNQCFSKVCALFLTPVFCVGEPNCPVKSGDSSNTNSGCECSCGCCNNASKGSSDTKSTQSDSRTPANNPQTPTKPSNKPCRGSTRSSPCSSPGDIDIDAISKELGGIGQIEWVAETDLSHCHLIRQASQVTVDSVTRTLTETASAYEDYHAEYRNILDTLIDTLEDSRKACSTELEVLECKLILIRAKADDMKRRIRELDMFICSLEKLGHAAAEAAFMAHAEYASIAMSERLQSLALEVKRLREESKEKERDMLELQALIIVESGKSLK